MNKCIVSLKTFIILLFKERVHLAQAVVLDHQQYLEAVRELTDWLINAGEELQTWSDTSGDSVSVRKKLSEVRVRQDVNIQKGLPLFLLLSLLSGFDNWIIKYRIVAPLFACFDNYVMC